MSLNRREFVEATMGVSAFAFSERLGAWSASMKSPLVPEGLRIVFQGDSITDAGRDRGQYYANQAGGMGLGYVYQIVAELLGANAGKDVKCFNRGISGNKVFQLADRWELDCLALRPEVLSILIGVNDFWHAVEGRYNGTVQVYKTDYRALLARTKKSLPDVRLIIGEPFAVKGGSAIHDGWSAFHEYRSVAKDLAEEFGAQFIPYQTIFDEALNSAPVSYWCPDGVHPSLAGAHLMKKAWMEAWSALW